MSIRWGSYYRSLGSLLFIGCIGCPQAAGNNRSIEAALGFDEVQPAAAAAPDSCVEVAEPVDAVHQAMFEALNLYRVQNGLNPLRYSRRLEISGDAYVQDLYERHYFAHVNPEGQDPGARALDAGFCHKYVGENLAAGQLNVAAAMLAWKNSPDHNENMLEPRYAYVGMGYYVDPTGRHYWAQEFAYDLP